MLVVSGLLTRHLQTFFFINSRPVKSYPCMQSRDLIPYNIRNVLKGLIKFVVVDIYVYQFLISYATMGWILQKLVSRKL
jgi:hypothetical protein